MSDSSLVMAELRQLLQETPTLNQWWKAVALVEGVENAEGRELLRGYLQAHAGNDSAWALCRAPNGDWPENHDGWALSEVSKRGMEQFPGVMEHYCPPGQFWMGAIEGDSEAYEDESPRREVTLTRGFWMMEKPVSQRLFREVMEKNSSLFPGEELPVDHVAWFDAILFCNRLSTQLGLTPCYELEGVEGWQERGPGEERPKVHWNREANGYRLPTEAEWEYAARAGTTAPRYGELEEIAWYEDNSQSTKEAGQKKPNSWGFHDLLGNVWEWCYDFWSATAYEYLPDEDPVEELTEEVISFKDLLEDEENNNSFEDFLENESSEDDYPEELERVLRGGCWLYSKAGVRASFRVFRPEHVTEPQIGLRVVRW